MKILINKFGVDKTVFLQNWFNENIVLDGQITEIDYIYRDCVFEDFDFIDGNYIFNKENFNSRVNGENNAKQLEDKRIEVYTLTKWFDTTYRYKTEKYARLIALNKLDDDGRNPSEKLNELYEEAENVRLEIQRLEEELKNGNEWC